MNKVDWIMVLAVVLLLGAGVIIGQEISFEVKLSDVLSLIAVMVTFLFAYNGLRHNERQYLTAIRPIISKVSYLGAIENSFTFTLHNYGSGAALHINYIYLHDDKQITYGQFKSRLDEFASSRSIEFKVGGPAGILAGGSSNLIEVKGDSRQTYQEILDFVSSYNLVIEYECIQGITEKKKFCINGDWK